MRIVEIAPPTVATDLHRESENLDDNEKEDDQAAPTLEFVVEVAE